MTKQQRIELTVKEYAQRERVTERTVWSWIAKGAVETRRTPGGGVRVFMLCEDVALLKNAENLGSPSV